MVRDRRRRRRRRSVQPRPRPREPLGKLLRIDPNPGNGGGYTIPADNPFGTEVWGYGLRNPFRFSFDVRGTGDLFIGDVGQGAREEIDWAPYAEGLGRGADYGWSCLEGTVAGPRACAPTGATWGRPGSTRRSHRAR